MLSHVIINYIVATYTCYTNLLFTKKIVA